MDLKNCFRNFLQTDSGKSRTLFLKMTRQTLYEERDMARVGIKIVAFEKQYVLHILSECLWP